MITFTGLIPLSIALSIAFNTRSWPTKYEIEHNITLLRLPLLRLINSNFCGMSVSRLILTEVRPASFNKWTFLVRVSPFVVSPIVLNPEIAESRAKDIAIIQST